MRLTLLLSVLLTAASVFADDDKTISFTKQELDAAFRSEGVAVGDFNKDGKKDVAAGYVWYEAPDWKMHAIVDPLPEFQVKGYAKSFCTYAEDVNQDGWDDIMIVTWPGRATLWFENPKGERNSWAVHLAAPVSSNESPLFADIDKDGKREFVMPVAPNEKVCDGPDRQMAVVKRGADCLKPWIASPISAKEAPGTRRYSHGLGVGDINSDGLNDVVITKGWWQAPATGKSPWSFHEAPLGEDCAHMAVADWDGDGDADVVSSSAHRFGIWWHEQLGEGKWETHLIDKSYSQTHSLCMADINGDGLPDFVTGKRWYAHNGRDPGADGPAVLFWYELTRKNGRPAWKSHLIDNDSGVGTQFEVADIDGDGLLDVITSNKKGVHVFVQERK
jgi:hypothetical protein